MAKKRSVGGQPESAADRPAHATAAPAEAVEEASRGPRRVASFVVEVVLDERGEVRRTSVLHVADNEQESWAGWEPQGVTDFVAGRFGAPHVRPPVDLAGPSPGLHVTQVQATALATASGAPLLVEGGSFEVQVTLDPGEAPSSGPFEYQAVVHAKLLGTPTRQRVGELRGRLAGGERAQLLVPAMAPPRGLYRLEMDLTMGGERARGQAGISGGLLQVS
jgi:hypothetical protein